MNDKYVDTLIVKLSYYSGAANTYLAWGPKFYGAKNSMDNFQWVIGQ